ncbi:Tyrosine recombinase XerD [anaerobic digester metagenome]|uniref:tyrosine-type recombinase/integrase n=1 Tax=Oscillibacter ruminantium TaxID=1263547 RepID=UPI0002DEF6F6|nr:tyrosine-type recombinase/integrase [Oscillibacter ruminantium]
MTTEYLLHEQVNHVLSALTKQNALIIQTVLHTGLRISDVLELHTEDLKPSMWVVEKKTGKRHRCGLTKPLLEAVRQQAGPVWAFPGAKPGNHKTRQAVWKDVKRAAKAFRLEQNVAPHSFRKIYAVELMQRYGDIRRVQRAMEHASPSVTAIYVMADALLYRKNVLAEQRRRKFLVDN